MCLVDMDKLRWEKYKDFFQITIFKYLVVWFSLVPIVAQIIEGLEIQTHNNDVFKLSDALPFSWPILWLSSFFFLIAMAIYYIRCPKFIKRYNQYSDYLNSGHDPRWLVWEATEIVNDKIELSKFVERLSEKKFVTKHKLDKSLQTPYKPVVKEKVTALKFNFHDKTYELAMPQEEDIERSLFWEIFGRYSSSKSRSRSSIFLLLVLSGLLFGFVLIQHIWFGVAYVHSELVNICQEFVLYLAG